jgi:glutamine amidotransferase PdxT
MRQIGVFSGAKKLMSEMIFKIREEVDFPDLMRNEVPVLATCSGVVQLTEKQGTK